MSAPAARRACVCAALLAVSGAAGRAGAQSVQIIGPTSNPITDAVATFVVNALNFSPIDLPLRLRLQVATSDDFAAPLFADTTVDGPSATITIPRLLPGSGTLYWRAFALTARAGSVPSAIVGPRTAPTHLSLVSPNSPAGQTIRARRPTFVWDASTMPTALGAWEFELRVEATGTGQVVLVVNTTEESHTPAIDLEINTSYRWRVKARSRTLRDSVEVSSNASFVIVSDEQPLTTLLQAPFPSPFPSTTSRDMCVWFDLARAGPVVLDILDFRGALVRRLVPGPAVGSALVPGRYGRPSPSATSGCDPRFVWDGTDATGRTVASGVYVIRLRADGRNFIERVVFRGR